MSQSYETSGYGKYNYNGIHGAAGLYPGFDIDNQFLIPGMSNVKSGVKENPCKSCIFRNCKIESYHDNLVLYEQEEVGLEDDDFDVDGT